MGSSSYRRYLIAGLAVAVFLPTAAFAGSAIVATICDAYSLIGTQAGKAIMTLAVLGIGFMALAAGKLNLPMCLVVAIGGSLLLSPCPLVRVITGASSPCVCGGGGSSRGPAVIPGTVPITGCPIGVSCMPENTVDESPYRPTPD